MYKATIAAAAACLLSTSLQAQSITGTWTMQWKDDSNIDIRAPLVIKADSGTANALDGVLEVKGANGVYYGTLTTDGKKWTGNWWNPGSVYGSFELRLENPNKLEGTFTKVGGTAKPWSGTR